MAQTSFTHADLEALWVTHGGTEQSADTAAAIAQAESGGCLYAKHGPRDDRPEKICTFTRSTKENSYGLWQINRFAHPQYSASSLYTAAGNVTAAVAIADGGASFSAWTTFTNGAYKQFLTGTVSTTPQFGPTFTVTDYGQPEDALKGWHHFNLALASSLPTALKRSKIIRAAAMRKLA